MHSKRYAFILRVWVEVDGTLPGTSWRGSLQKVDGESLSYFDSLPMLIALLTAATGWEADPRPPEEFPRNKS